MGQSQEANGRALSEHMLDSKWGGQADSQVEGSGMQGEYRLVMGTFQGQHILSMKLDQVTWEYL